MSNMLQRLRELALQAASGTLTANDRSEIQREFSNILSQLNRIASQTEFNTMNLLDGSSSILASSSNDLLQLLVGGSGLSRDQFGTLQSLEGRYRLELQATPGQAQIKNSNIFNLINGTKSFAADLTPTEKEYSGLLSLVAQGLAVGDYRIESRASPFGNIYYLNRLGAETTNPALDIGINSVATSPSPQIMPFGEYNLSPAGRVPFMATFADFVDPALEGLTDDIIRGVNRTTRNNIDVNMDILANQGAADAETQLAWRNIGGLNTGTVLINAGGDIHPESNITVATKDDFNINLYSHFRITGEQDRDVLATDVEAVTYYRSVNGSELELDLTYRAGAGQAITAKTSFILQGNVEITMNGTTTTIPINDMDIEEACAELAVESPSPDLNFTIQDNLDGTRRIVVTNNTGDIVEIDGAGAAQLGIVGNIADGDSSEGVLLEYELEHTFDVENQTITDIASALDDVLEPAYDIAVTAADNMDGTRQLEINNTGAYRLEIASGPNPTSVQSELGLNAYGVQVPGINWQNGTKVYHEHTLAVDIGNRRLDEIADQLNIELQTALALDDLNNNTAAPFTLHDPGDDTRIIYINNAASPTSYEITISDSVHTTAAELGLDTTVNRDSNFTAGDPRDFGNALGTLTAGNDLEELQGEIDNLAGWLTATWLLEPDYVGTRFGQLEITNTDASPERREVVFLDSAGTTQLFAAGDVTLQHDHETTIDNTIQSEEWLARDRVQVQYTYRGISNNGAPVSGSRTDTWWRGERGDLNPLLTQIPAHHLPFTSIYMPEKVNGSGPTVGDNWMLFTKASAGNDHTILDFNVYDLATNANYSWAGATHGGGRYAFNQGILDDNSISIPQCTRTNTYFNQFNHNIDFGVIATWNNAVTYSQRYSTADYNHYSHTYYGDDTTYFFAEGGDWSDYLQDISVWRQNEINASLLFTNLDGNNFRVEGKGYDRQGNEWTLYPPENITLGGGPVNINGIHFDRFQLGGGFTAGDKFVVNVAAKAGPGRHEFPPTHSDANIRISGNPWFSGGSSMEYRFAEDAVNGMELDLLGYFVDPLLGFDDDIGVWTGSLLMDVTGDGFRKDNRVHHGQNVIMEINYMGTTEPIAAALLTGYYFQNMQENESYRDLIDTIEYNQNETKNASMLLEVVEKKGNSMVVRAQAHIYEKDGTYHYAFDDYITLGEKNTNITFFGQCGPGLNFSQFDFEDIHRFETGDRFSLTLAANGEPSGSSDDEIYLWSSAYGRDIYPHSWRFDNNVLDHRHTTLRTYQVDYYNGTVYDAEIDFEFADFHGGTDTGEIGSTETPRVIRDTARFNSEQLTSHHMGPAHRYSRLRDIDMFWTSDGRFLLQDPAEIKIWHGGIQASVMLYGSDEIMDVLDRINRAIYDQLNQGEFVSEQDSYKFASFVNTASTQNTLEVMEGSMLIRSALTGRDGQLLFQGSEELLRALGLSIIEEGEENLIQVSLYERNGGERLQAQEVIQSGSSVFGMLHENIGINVDPRLGIEKVVYNKCSENFELVASQSENIYVSLVDNSKVLQIGANRGQTAWLSLGDFSPASLGLANLTVLNTDEANHAVRRIDRAIEKLSAQRSSLGALQNRLEHTMNNLMVSQENLTNAESRIRDADMAQELLQLTKQNVIMQTASQLAATAKLKSQLVLELVNSL